MRDDTAGFEEDAGQRPHRTLHPDAFAIHHDERTIFDIQSSAGQPDVRRPILDRHRAGRANPRQDAHAAATRFSSSMPHP